MTTPAAGLFDGYQHGSFFDEWSGGGQGPLPEYRRLWARLAGLSPRRAGAAPGAG